LPTASRKSWYMPEPVVQVIIVVQVNVDGALTTEAANDKAAVAVQFREAFQLDLVVRGTFQVFAKHVEIFTSGGSG
jgi:hypothetical protein